MLRYRDCARPLHQRKTKSPVSPGFFFFRAANFNARSFFHEDSVSTNKRIRGRALQAIRERVLRAAPLCVLCAAQGRVRAAVQVDHIIAVTHGGDDDAYDDSNRQSLCAECHASKTRADLGQRQRNACDVNGYPLGAHHWNDAGAVEKSTPKAGKPAAQRPRAKSRLWA